APVNVNFDLATTLAVQLHAGRLTPAELDARWLAEHSPAILRRRAAIAVTHDPRLTLRVIDGARALADGRAALARVSARDWLRLSRHYRDAYASELVSAQEALAWIGALGKWLAAPPPARARGSSTPLHFPSRVTAHFADGTTMTVEHETPSGSVALPEADTV